MSDKITVGERLSIIETDITYLKKGMDTLTSKLPTLFTVETNQKSLEKRVLVLETKSTKKDLLIWGALISAIIALAIKDVFL
jgi:hypothetical protein